MRVTIHTPGVLVEEYDVADRLAAAADEAILAAIRRKSPVSSVQEDGDAVVWSRGADAVEEAAARLAATREAFETAKKHAQKYLRSDVGYVHSERQLAQMFGVDRLTIRAWRGKGR